MHNYNYIMVIAWKTPITRVALVHTSLLGNQQNKTSQLKVKMNFENQNNFM